MITFLQHHIYKKNNNNGYSFNTIPYKIYNFLYLLSIIKNVNKIFDTKMLSIKMSPPNGSSPDYLPGWIQMNQNGSGYKFSPWLDPDESKRIRIQIFSLVGSR